jgi:hypothetical protein
MDHGLITSPPNGHGYDEKLSTSQYQAVKQVALAHTAKSTT